MACTSAGTKIYYSYTTGSSALDYTELTKSVSISLSGGSIAEVDITTLDSTGQYAEFCPDVIDPGTLSVTVNLTDDSETQIEELYDLIGETLDLKVEYTTDSVWTAQGYLNPPSYDVAVGSAITFTFEFRLTGVTDFIANAS